LYRQQVNDLHTALNDPEGRTEAAAILRRCECDGRHWAARPLKGEPACSKMRAGRHSQLLEGASTSDQDRPSSASKSSVKSASRAEVLSLASSRDAINETPAAFWTSESQFVQHV
jgi:hypothetical protein